MGAVPAGLAPARLGVPYGNGTGERCPADLLACSWNHQGQAFQRRTVWGFLRSHWKVGSLGAGLVTEAGSVLLNSAFW